MSAGRMLAGLALIATLAIVASTAFAQPAYPSRPVRLVVAYSPGAGVDLMSRAMAQRLGEALGQPAVVENRPGGNGIVGAETVAHASADGHTLLVIDRGALVLNPSLYKSLGYDPLRHFAYTGIATELPYVLAVSAGSGIASLADLAARARAKPKALNYASVGPGSLIHLNFEALSQHLGIEMTHVPYKGTQRTVSAVATGESAVMMSSLAGVAGFIRDGRLRAIAVGRGKRFAALPDVPTIAEAGGGADTLAAGYFTFVAPAGTPPAIVARLHEEMAQILARADMIALLDRAGLEPAVTAPAAFTDTVKRDIARFAKLVTALGISPQ